MNKRVINNYDKFALLLGKEIGTSDFIHHQERINQFAEAMDHQWIHTDPKRAAMESPFKSTIAHGYHIVSMLTYLWFSITET